MNLESIRLYLQFNPYHLVTQLPWPLLVSFSLLSFTLFIIVFGLYSQFWVYYLYVCTVLLRSLAEQLNDFSPVVKVNESLLATVICNCSTFVFNINKFKHVTNEEQLKLLRADLKNVLVGTLLGDGYIGHGNSRFYGFKQGLIHVDYFAFIYLIFQPYLNKGSPNINPGGKIHTGLRLAISTKYNQLLSILELDQNFYINKNGRFFKRVPEQIATLMNPVVLAFLIKNDGHHSHSKGMILNVQGFEA